MPYLDGTKVFSNEVMQWLHSKDDVEKLVLTR
jgi:hypothetical protein